VDLLERMIEVFSESGVRQHHAAKTAGKLFIVSYNM
jgi:hypothetical protein